MISPYEIQTAIANLDITSFAENVLGMQVHDGQKFWFRESTKAINVLKPANQWGKTTAEAIKHIYHAVTKPQLNRFDMSLEDKMRFDYKTLNAGKTYEVARGVLEQAVDIAESKYLLPSGHYNKSLLRGWAIKEVWEAAPKLPQIA